MAQPKIIWLKIRKGARKWKIRWKFRYILAGALNSLAGSRAARGLNGLSSLGGYF